MAQQTVGIGTVANDGTGDAPRTAGQKINSNFDELYAAIASLTSSVAGKANTSHTHLVANISDATTHAKQLLQSYANTDFAAGAHSHILSDVEELVEALAGKSNGGHTHTQGEVSGLVSALANKSPVGHGHTMTELDFADEVLDVLICATTTEMKEAMMVHVPKTSTDAGAMANSIYYSSTQSKLVYKDPGGTVHNLY